MRKITLLFAMMLLAASAWAQTSTATFNLGASPGVSTPDGYFTHDETGKWNFNSKFSGGEYDGLEFSKGLKIENATRLYFTTSEISTVTIVQSTYDSNTFYFDENEVALEDAVDGTGCRIYTLNEVPAGDHTISRGSGETGLFYIKVSEGSTAWTSLPVVPSVSGWSGESYVSNAPPVVDSDGAYKVYARQSSNAWDAQFHICFGEENALSIGDELSVTFKVKADVPATFGTQSDAAPGAYLHWNCINSVDATTSWTEITREVKAEDFGGTTMNGMYTITFNLAGEQDNNFYFKDIEVKVKSKPIYAWVDIISVGEILNGTGSCFYSKVYPANTSSLATITDNMIAIDAPAKVSASWETGFFIRLPQTLPAGTPYRISFDYKASANAVVETQSHNEPDQYVHWNAIGDIGFTTSWQSFKTETTVSEYCDGEPDGSYNKDFRTIAFLLSQASPVTYYIRNIKVEIPNDAVTVDIPSHVYSEFVEDAGTLTFYYDDKRFERSGITERFDPVGAPDAVRYADYYKKVTKMVFDPSMKQAPLTSFKDLTFGGSDPETYDMYVLQNVTSVEGLNNLNTGIVTNMNSMFSMLYKVTSLDLSSFNTSNVTSMNGMFLSCGVKTLDVSTFDISKVTDMRMMFGGCSELTTIYCKADDDWSGTTAQSNYMFTSSRKLVGGEGTVYNSSVTDATYARCDGGTSRPGYFTEKSNIRGDLNGDGAVDISDAVVVLDVMASGTNDPAADFNGDSSVDISDFVCVLDFMAGI